MNSDQEMLEPQVDDTPEFEIIEGDVVEPEPERAIVSTENAGVLVPYEEPKPRYVEPEQPAYKNRALIAAVFAMVGIFAGRMTIAPKETVKIVEKPVAVPTVANGPVEEAPVVVANPFRTLANTEEFDPWQPLNGGFPIPPKDVELAIAARSGNVLRPPNMSGTGFDASGPIEPFDPALLPGGLPSVSGDLNPLPQTPVPGGGVTTQPSEGTKPAQAGGKERYVQIAMNGPAPEAGQKSLLGIAASAGGTGRSFVHYSEEGTVESHGVLLIIPAGQYEPTLKKIEGLGGAEQEGNYEGNVLEQQSRIQGMFVVRLAKLNEKRKDLLVDFLEDAQPVKQINEAIDQETRAVSATRLPGGMSGKVVIRVLLK